MANVLHFILWYLPLKCSVLLLCCQLKSRLYGSSFIHLWSYISQHTTVTLHESNKYATYTKKEKALGQKPLLRYFIVWIIHIHTRNIWTYKIYHYIIYGYIFLLKIVQATFSLCIKINAHAKLTNRPSMEQRFSADLGDRVDQVTFYPAGREFQNLLESGGYC